LLLHSCPTAPLGSSGHAILNSTSLHNVLLPGAGTSGKTCPRRAMMATSDTVRRFRLPVAGSRRCLYDRVPYSTPSPRSPVPVPALVFGVGGRRVRPIHRPWLLIAPALWAGVARRHPPIFLVSPPWRASDIERGSGAVKGHMPAEAGWRKRREEGGRHCHLGLEGRGYTPLTRGKGP